MIQYDPLLAFGTGVLFFIMYLFENANDNSTFKLFWLLFGFAFLIGGFGLIQQQTGTFSYSTTIGLNTGTLSAPIYTYDPTANLLAYVTIFIFIVVMALIIRRIITGQNKNVKFWWQQ